MAAPVDIERELATFAGVLRHEGCRSARTRSRRRWTRCRRSSSPSPTASTGPCGWRWCTGATSSSPSTAPSAATGRRACPARAGGRGPARRRVAGAARAQGRGRERGQTADRDSETASGGSRSLEPGDASELPSPTSTRRGRTARWRCCAARTSPPTRRRTTRVSPTSSACARSAARGGSAAAPPAPQRAPGHAAHACGGLRSGGCRCGASTAVRPAPPPAALPVRRVGLDGQLLGRLLHLTHAAVRGRERVEVFGFATRLTRITPDLVDGDPSRAIHQASARLVDWSGGTRIGTSIGTLVREHPGLRARLDGDRGQRRLGLRRPGGARGRDRPPPAPGATRRSGSTRSSRTRPSNRSPRGCRRRCRTSTISCPATTSTPSSRSEI